VILAILTLSLCLCAAVVSAAPETRRNPKDRQTYIHIPAGSFSMGCSDGDKECYEDERPAHMVQITKDFWIGQTEVTVAAFRRYAEIKGVPVPPDQKADKYPVMAVIWDEANAYCTWAGGRLPTEAEWEYAARGGTTTVRYGDLNAIAWTSTNSQHMPHEVAKKMPNAYGLYDMLGNAWEWVADWYGSKYYEHSAAADPPGPPTGDTLIQKGIDMPVKVIRGGAWIGFPGVARASYRYWFIPALRVANIGFRCVLKEN
jgi:formylglycine-generating enzyme required for sulfatase activity